MQKHASNRKGDAAMKKRTITSILRTLVFATFVAATLFALAPTRAEGKAWDAYAVEVRSGYLALRDEPARDESNEIGELYTGEIVYLKGLASSDRYWYVYSKKLGEYGWVDKNYLVRMQTTMFYRQVHVDSGYLALRTQARNDDANIIGELYTGDVVRCNDSRDYGGYRFVYSPKLGKMGYVNKIYLVEFRTYR